jgi:hypothetical protein
VLNNNKLVGKLNSRNLVGRVLTKLLGLDFVWDGTRLGVKKENETEYEYADLVGPEGPQGKQGQQGMPGVNGNDGYTPRKRS